MTRLCDWQHLDREPRFRASHNVRLIRCERRGTASARGGVEPTAKITRVATNMRRTFVRGKDQMWRQKQVAKQLPTSAHELVTRQAGQRKGQLKRVFRPMVWLMVARQTDEASFTNSRPGPTSKDPDATSYAAPLSKDRPKAPGRRDPCQAHDERARLEERKRRGGRGGGDDLEPRPLQSDS